MTTAGQHYRVVHTELVDLAATLNEHETEQAVPALPGWTVRDTYAHLSGVCADILAGTVGDPHDETWTAQHVETRKNLSLTDICRQWQSDATQVEELLDRPELRRAVFAVFDVFHHAHDIRAALGRPDARNTPQAAFVAALMTKFKAIEWAKQARPPVKLTTTSGSWILGATSPAADTPAGTDTPEPDVVAALNTTDFELSRIIIGRRSRAQILAAPWTGDPEKIVDHLPVFGPPVTDLTE